MTEYVAVTGSGPSAAFFDLDRTLISGSSAFTLAIQARKAGLVPTHEFARDAAGAVPFKLFGASDDTSDAGAQADPRAVTGLRQSRPPGAQRSRSCPASSQRCAPRRSGLLDRHRHAGRDTFIVSAAPQEIVEPLAQSLGMTSRGSDTRSCVDNGVYTGELDGPFCYGEGKVEAMQRAGNVERLRPRPVLRLQRLGERPADA